jgi:hypothetical protein
MRQLGININAARVPLLSRLASPAMPASGVLRSEKSSIYSADADHVHLTVHPAETLEERPPDTLILRYQAAAINARGA